MPPKMPVRYRLDLGIRDHQKAIFAERIVKGFIKNHPGDYNGLPDECKRPDTDRKGGIVKFYVPQGLDLEPIKKGLGNKMIEYVLEEIK